MFIVGQQFLSLEEEKNITELSFFFTYIYARHWFQSALLADAPVFLLDFWDELDRWQVRDHSLQTRVWKKFRQVRSINVSLSPTKWHKAFVSFKGQTWYLSERQFILGLWSKKVSDAEKVEMAEVLKSLQKSPKLPGKPHLPSIRKSLSLKDYVGKESFLLFEVISR